MSAPKKPDPPVVGKVTHHSIELYWDAAAKQDTVSKGDGRLRYIIQESDQTQGWGNVYTGYGTNHVFDGLDPSSQYRYRLKVMNNNGNSEFSPAVTVTTTKEPQTGEQLHKAIILTQDLQKAREILESGDVWIDVPDKFGYTPLMAASQKGVVEMVDLLIEHGADINMQNGSGKDALMLSCFAGHLDVVRRLLAHGASWEKKDLGGSTALHWAVDGGHKEIVQWAIMDGSKIDEKDSSSEWTPLMRCAAMGGNHEIGEILLLAGANVNMKDKDHKTPLMIAALNGHQKLVKVMVEQGADPLVKTEHGMSAYEMAKSFDRKRVMKYFEEVLQNTKSKKSQEY
ncbi:fibronectin type 3 and ankyrin repeat domains protein 1-like [Lytechinus variegatus]|uniref:fibronectin type 3 and ankyrin repeat domains protein 1-like n=1 Tax=Lytechinus variegatus TaxID=7654 RepID=UPI001BB154E2|nr:fibronectin type 3 and ankyrin repeat domains protein 1-like [Lytechinus variegatus]